MLTILIFHLLALLFRLLTHLFTLLAKLLALLAELFLHLLHLLLLLRSPAPLGHLDVWRTCRACRCGHDGRSHQEKRQWNCKLDRMMPHGVTSGYGASVSRRDHNILRMPVVLASMPCYIGVNI
ncbi:hypothetical protein C3920_04445 [Novacetimonas pomaceti]|uniref:Secreted protein n=1 Tax=Novacetimonas pomaceti TaxID=2021998 RepID=A0ABX5P648_9PROT|nr:hypothetical protein C3920_04445 [Novacetimonas pomaceti]